MTKLQSPFDPEVFEVCLLFCVLTDIQEQLFYQSTQISPILILTQFARSLFIYFFRELENAT